MKILILIVSLIVGFCFIKYSKWITDNTMRFESAEKFFGPAGTYTVWKLFGVGLIVFAFYYVFNF